MKDNSMYYIYIYMYTYDTEVLYIGITKDYVKRYKQHRAKNHEWFNKYTHYIIAECENKTIASLHEKYEINKYSDTVHNIVHNNGDDMEGITLSELKWRNVGVEIARLTCVRYISLCRYLQLHPNIMYIFLGGIKYLYNGDDIDNGVTITNINTNEVHTQNDTENNRIVVSIDKDYKVPIITHIMKTETHILRSFRLCD